MENNVVRAQLDNIDDLVLMALDLWDDNTFNGLKDEFLAMLESEDNAVLLYKIDNQYVGFIRVSIRHDYVEGSDSSPVGYIEGVYVNSNFRNRAIAKELVSMGEQWALSKGCTQMASDIEADNDVSYEFHKKIGFKEANRLICFIKNL